MKTQLERALEKFSQTYGRLDDDYWTLRSLDEKQLSALRRKYGAAVDKKLQQFDDIVRQER